MVTASDRPLRADAARLIVRELPREQWFEAWQGVLRYIVWLEQLQAGRLGL